MLQRWLLLIAICHIASAANRLSEERIVFQLGGYGNLEMALYPEVRLAMTRPL